eukprot:gene10458-biopygen8927
MGIHSGCRAFRELFRWGIRGGRLLRSYSGRLPGGAASGSLDQGCIGLFVSGLRRALCAADGAASGSRDGGRLSEEEPDAVVDKAFEYTRPRGEAGVDLPAGRGGPKACMNSGGSSKRNHHWGTGFLTRGL